MTTKILESEKRYREIIREDRVWRMGILAASLSHELFQPLAAILSTAQAGKRSIESGYLNIELLKEIFNNIVEDNIRATSILNNIRLMLKFEKKEKEKVDLNLLIREANDLFRSKAIEINIKVILSLHDKPVFVFADSIQIEQVILNLLSNASQAMVYTKDKINIIEVFERFENELVIVSVRDYGRGIDESIINKLFVPFITTRKDGNGVGLKISKMIMEYHDGNIWGKNMPDRGAEFSFCLNVCYET